MNMLGYELMVLRVCGENRIGKRNIEAILLEFCKERSCIWQTLNFKKRSKRKQYIVSLEMNQPLIFCRFVKKSKNDVEDVKTISRKLQYGCGYTDIGKRKLKEVLKTRKL